MFCNINSDTIIRVKNPGILEVPEGQNIWNLNKSHILNLVNKKGKQKISKALNNLQLNKDKKTKSAIKIKKWGNKATKWIAEDSNTMKASNIVSDCITNLNENEKEKIKGSVNPKDFFSTYSQVAGKIKKIKKLGKNKKEEAEKHLKEAIDALTSLKSVLD